MSKVEIDTRKLDSIGEDIVSLGQEYTEIINTIFDRIYGYSQAEVWVGNAAENYINLVRTEKSDYDVIGNIIKDYGRCLLNTADTYQNHTDRIERDNE